MNEINPWDHWVYIIRSYYPSGKRGRPPKEIETKDALGLITGDALNAYLMNRYGIYFM